MSTEVAIRDSDSNKSLAWVAEVTLYKLRQECLEKGAKPQDKNVKMPNKKDTNGFLLLN